MTTRSAFYTAEHEAFRDSVRAFVRKEIEPFATEWDEAGTFPRELYKKAADIGLIPLGYPEEYGGIEADLFYMILSAQELAMAGCGGLSASLMSHGIGSPPIVKYGSEELKQRVLPPIFAGDAISALAITEPGGGSDVAALKTTAKRDGDHYIVNGSKTFITSGMRADTYTVAVRTGEAGHKGISLLVIDRDTPGFTRTPLDRKMGWWCSDTATLYFDDCRVPVGNLLGEENQGSKMIMNNFNFERIFLAASCIGFARACYEEVVDYARQRQTFGRPLLDAPGGSPQAGRYVYEDRGQPGLSGETGLAHRAGREPGSRCVPAQEPEHPDHGVLRPGGGADHGWRRLPAWSQVGAYLPGSAG